MVTMLLLLKHADCWCIIQVNVCPANWLLVADCWCCWCWSMMLKHRSKCLTCLLIVDCYWLLIVDCWCFCCWCWSMNVHLKRKCLPANWLRRGFGSKSLSLLPRTATMPPTADPLHSIRLDCIASRFICLALSFWCNVSSLLSSCNLSHHSRNHPFNFIFPF